MSDTLSELFRKARAYGLVDLFTLDGGTYACNILLAAGRREVKAKSGYDHLTPDAAVRAAIKVAASMTAVKSSGAANHSAGTCSL